MTQRMLQLDPPIPLMTPKGEGYANFLIDYGQEHNLEWVVFITATNEIWSFRNHQVRTTKNITLGRVNKIDLPEWPAPKE